MVGSRGSRANPHYVKVLQQPRVSAVSLFPDPLFRNNFAAAINLLFLRYRKAKTKILFQKLHPVFQIDRSEPKKASYGTGRSTSTHTSNFYNVYL